MDEYEKKYREALKKAEKNYKTAQDLCEGSQIGVECFKNTLANIFPELAESEDEKIRKEIISHLQYLTKYCKESINVDNLLSWLKKQGEQKPADSVEPKFKVGDWIVFNRNDSSREILYVYDIRDDRYYFNDNIHFSWSVKECDEKSHLWSIEDAKDGDVLYSLDSNQPFIYKERKPNEQATAYCGLNIYGKFFVWGTKDCVITLSNYVPATKEQRDTLVKAMADAGWKFDFEKKELKKIDFNPDDLIEESYQQQADDLIDAVTEKSSWSEEDDRMLNHAIVAMSASDYYVYDDKQELENWLKSLKDRVQPQNRWKPSDEQMEALADALSLAKNCGEERAFDLRTLYEQLQKIKENKL